MKSRLSSKGQIILPIEPRELDEIAAGPQPNQSASDWLTRNESEIVVNPIVLGELEYGILLLPYRLTIATRSTSDFLYASVKIVNPSEL